MISTMESSAKGFPASPPTIELPLRGKSGRSGRNLAALLFDEFASKIRNGLLAEGEKLPTESSLVQTYEVSRTVVREALSRLQASGLVERSEEHTSELQSPDHLVCRLLLEKKKQTRTYSM